MMPEIKTFNIRVHPLLREEFISIIMANLKKGNRIAQFGVNSATINEVNRDEKFRNALNKADLLNIDGMSVVWALRCLGFNVPERVATPDLADAVLAMAAKEKFSVFLLGAKEERLTTCCKQLMETYPEIKIAGFRNGYFEPEEESRIIEIINNSEPDILLIGMTSPKKEIFYFDHMNELNAKYILGVGGYFDILAGHTKRAPRWMQDIGLEWIFRLLQEPRRMWKRYLIGNNRFLLTVIREKIRRNRIVKRLN
jgi:N-acetylglucosaminyldiphosphoundecaprenol N-acetyl-beta-D-mannosaminyltransferase